MHGHEQFEELATLAAIGELTENEWQTFKRHRENCSECRRIYADLTDVALFLADTNCVLQHEEGAVDERGMSTAWSSIEHWRRRLPRYSPSPIYSWPAAALGAAAGLMLATGVSIGILSHLDMFQNRGPVVKIGSPSIPMAEVTSARAEAQAYQKRTDDLEREIAKARAENERLSNDLSSSTATSKQLRQAVTSADLKINSQATDLSEAQAALALSRQALAQIQLSKASNEASFLEVQYKLNEAERKLRDALDARDRERQMLGADREIRDIMGARDLHIVDVFDVDGKGRTKRSFGRAFYTEGKSLIFYAYDLPTTSTKDGRFAYRAWGKNSNSPQGALHSLGIFYNDDQAQRRWVMKYDNPKVLAEIDTVFVTLEPADLNASAPTGKPILDAYFGTPANHP